VISLDAFFASQLSPPAQYVMNDQMAAVHYESEHIAQYFHRQICGRLPSLCGKEYSVYRSERTGAWYATPARFLRVPAVADTAIDQTKASQELVAARAFLASLPVDKDCIILTIVPTVGTRRDAAAALAGALDRPFVSPELTGLYTFDGSHLEPQSAQRWAQAFFDAAGPRIRACVGGAGAPAALAAEQHTKIWSTLRGEKAERLTNVEFSTRVGGVVPATVHLYRLPVSIVEYVPQYRDYEYILVGDEILIVDPRTLRIVAVIAA